MPPREALPEAVANRYDAHLAHQDRIRGSSIYPAIQNINLACRALGLGTVITTNHILYEGEVREILRLPDDVFTFALMPMGYPVGKYGPLSRRPVSQVAFRSMGRTMDGSWFNGEVEPQRLPLSLAAGIVPLCRKSCRHSRQRG